MDLQIFRAFFFITDCDRSRRSPAARFRPKKTAPWHSSCKVGGRKPKQNLHHESAKTHQRRHADRHFRFGGNAQSGTHGIHPQGQDGSRDRLPVSQGRDLSADTTAAEPRHVRNDLHGRLRHTADERGHQHQLHRRNGVPACRGDVRPLPEHRRQHVEHPREGRMEDRCAGHRFVGGMYAGRRGRMAPLAPAPQGRRQALRQTEPGDERRVPGRMGEVLPAVADRNAHRAPDARPHHARPQAGAGDVRREHDLHRADRRRHVDGPGRRHRGAGQGARRVQRQDRL